jgi:hypothetical protein
MKTPMIDRLLNQVSYNNSESAINTKISNVFLYSLTEVECNNFLSEMQAVKDALNTKIKQDIKVEMRVPADDKKDVSI